MTIVIRELKKRRPTPETIVKRQVKAYLSLKGYFHFGILQGLGASPGIPDRIAIKASRVIFIEIKKPGGKQSEGQKIFEQNIINHGGEYALISSIDELQKIGI